MSIPAELKYTKEHEWIRIDGNSITLGITDHAQQQLGDIVYLELPEEDDEVEKSETFGVVESTKAVSDLYSPINGKVIEINESLVDGPETINSDPYGDGWMLKIEASDLSELDGLMDAAAYSKFIEESE